MFALLFGLAMVPRAVAAEPDWGTLPAELHPDTEALARASSRDDDEDDDDDKPRKKKSADEDEDDKKPVSTKGKAAVAKSNVTAEAAERLARIDRKWAKVDQRAQLTHSVGRGMFTVGGLMFGLGDGAVGSTGYGLYTFSTPVMAAGALRARRSLNERGADVSGWAGYSAWACWGGALAMEFSAVGRGVNGDDAGAGLFLLGGVLVNAAGAGLAAFQENEINDEQRFDIEKKSNQGSRHENGPTLALTGFDVSPVEGGARLGLSGTF